MGMAGSGIAIGSLVLMVVMVLAIGLPSPAQGNEQALNALLQRQQEHQAASVGYKKERDKVATATTTAPIKGSKYQLRLQQLQQAQSEGHSSRRPHHLRHEQHLRAELEANKQPALIVGNGNGNGNGNVGQQQHHLRHHNRHHAAWEQRVFPTLRHQQHRLAIVSTSTTEAPAALPHVGGIGNLSVSRYFDRDGIYAWAEQSSTRAPKWSAQMLDASDNEPDYEDDEDDDDDDDEEDNDDEYSDELEAAAKQMPRYSLFTPTSHAQMRAEPQSTEDYSVEVAEQTAASNKHPSIAEGSVKSAAKRNIFDWLFKRDKDKATQSQSQSQSQAQSQATTAGYDKPSLEVANDGNDGSDLDDSFSNEQWNKIEHDHHLRQQKHQKELQALRDSNRNAPLVRGIIDNEDADNIYSRNYITGTLTRHKVEQLGTAEAVKRTHHQRMQAGAHERALAREHLNKILKEAKCHVPQRYCERIQRDPSKIYTPHCTILYRCSEDSGCCQSRSQICAPKQTKSVELHFYVKSSNQRRAVTEKLTFVNHTECHCIERGKYETEGGANAPVLQRATLLNCNCPKLFEKILQEDGYCRCDCSSGNYGCDWLKRGSEHFSMNDRKCIQQGRCKTPTCEYGTYLEKHGRCPKQHEQPQSQSQLPSFNAMS